VKWRVERGTERKGTEKKNVARRRSRLRWISSVIRKRQRAALSKAIVSEGKKDRSGKQGERQGGNQNLRRYERAIRLYGGKSISQEAVKKDALLEMPPSRERKGGRNGVKRKASDSLRGRASHRGGKTNLLIQKRRYPAVLSKLKRGAPGQ